MTTKKNTTRKKLVAKKATVAKTKKTVAKKATTKTKKIVAKKPATISSKKATECKLLLKKYRKQKIETQKKKVSAIPKKIKMGIKRRISKW